MARRSLLVLPLMLLLSPGCGADSSPSVFRTTYMAVSEPGPGLPRFTAAAYVDDLPIAHYDSNTGKVWNRAKWMEKLLQLHPEYQDKYEKLLRRDGADFTAALGAVQATHNQSAGFHTWQMVAGCEESDGGPRGRYLRFGYDGRDFLSLDVETFNWTAANAAAQITKRSWEANPSVTRRFRAYVEETCAEWIQAELDHGKERLQKRNPPEIKVTQKDIHGGLEMLICVARGFYPKEIDLTWTRDGKVWMQNTSHGFLTPLTESTYYYWLGIKISPKDRVRYQCHVKHDGLQRTLHKAWNEFEDSSPSVFRTIYTAVSEPGPGLPRFAAVVFVGDLPIACYDSNSRNVWYKVAWMEKLLELRPEYQDKYEKMLQQDKADFTAALGAVQATHNQSAGLHTWQMQASCEVGPDRRKGQYLRFGYDGRDFLSLEVETLTWMAVNATAQVIQRSWEESQYITTRFKAYVGETCSLWLQAEREQGREGSQKRAPPLMKVTRRAAYENLEILVCRAYGFYPGEIDMRWTIDGEAWEEDSFHWILGPNSDGTYYARLDLRVDTWNRQHVRCRVQHSLLQDPQDLVLEEPGGSPRSVFHTTYTAVSEPGPGLPQFTAAAYVDDLPIARYDSDTRALRSQTSWAKKMLELHPEYQVNYTQQLQQDEADFRAMLTAVQATHNQSEGLHTWQMMAGCEVGLDRPRGRYLRFGYDGRDFLSLDVETFNWTAADATAQITKRSWEANPSATQRFRAYVEETCAEWSRARLGSGGEGLQRAEPPKMVVTRKPGQDNMETLICRAHGFYPREINMVWTRDGEAWLQDASPAVLAPNSDGTYHARLDLEIDSAERERFRCRVGHDTLPKPLIIAWKDSGGSPRSLFRTTYTAVSEPGPGLPQFAAAAYADDQPIARYDSDTGALLAQAPWLEKMLQEHPEYRDKYTQMLQQDEADFTAGLTARQTSYNQSEGLHTWQMVASCEGGLGKPTERDLQFGYDGRDFLCLDMQAVTWTAADVEAHRTKRSWLSDPAVAQRFRAYVDQTCAEWSQARLDAGQEGLRRTESPKVTVTRRAGPGSTETLTCHARGFYPQRIDVKWSRDKAVWVRESSRGVLAPNSDGTFYFWLGIEIDPAERQHFWCHVEHETLPEPVIKTWEDPTAFILWMVLGVLGALLLVVVATVAWRRVKRLQGGCRAAASEKHQDGREAELEKLHNGLEATESS